MKWTTLAAFTLSTLCLSAASGARADDDPADPDEKVPPLIEWPDGQTVAKRDDLSFRDGSQYKCFRTEEYQTIAHIVVDYRWLHGYVLRLEMIVGNYSRQVATMQSMVVIWKEQVGLLERERGMLTDLYDEEHRLRLAAERKWRSTKTWLIVGNVVLGAATIGMSIYAGAK